MIVAITVLAMFGMGVRPFRIPTWVWPVVGALLLLVLRYESIASAMSAIVAQWNVLLFITGLMGIAAAAEISGAFAWIASYIVHAGQGSRRKLFVYLFLAGAAMTLLLSNDATAVVLTPIVYVAVARRQMDPMPFLFGCTFVADTASFGLPFSNPANVLIVPHANLLHYLVHLGPPQLAAIAINLALFLWIFRARLSGGYDREPPEDLHPRACRALIAMACVAVAYFVAVALSWPLGPVAVIGAIVTLFAALVKPLDAARGISWSTLVLLAALFVMLDGVARAGGVAWMSRTLADTSQYGRVTLETAAVIGAATMSNLFNNLPVAAASAYVVANNAGQHLAYPLIVGVDVGPNLTTTGSLATILWIDALRKRGVQVNAFEYLRLGLMTVTPIIAVTVLWLWLVH